MFASGGRAGREETFRDARVFRYSVRVLRSLPAGRRTPLSHILPRDYVRLLECACNRITKPIWKRSSINLDAASQGCYYCLPGIVRHRFSYLNNSRNYTGESFQNYARRVSTRRTYRSSLDSQSTRRANFFRPIPLGFCVTRFPKAS